MVALLKQKSKIRLEKRPRVKYEIKNIFKQAKIDPAVNAQSKAEMEGAVGLSSTSAGSKKIQPLIVEKYDEQMDTPGEK